MSSQYAGRACERSSLCEAIHNVGAFMSMLAAVLLWGMVILMVGCVTVREPVTVTQEVLYDL